MATTEPMRGTDATAAKTGGDPGLAPATDGPLRPITLAVAALTAALLALAPSPAHGSEGEAGLWIAALGANASDASGAGPQFGVGGQAGVNIGISDFWTLNFGAEGVFHPPASPDDDELSALFVQDLFAGFRYNLDIFTYVPYAKFSAVAYPAAPILEPGQPQRAAVGAKLTVGVDWRFDRHWAFGGMAELHTIQFDFESFPSYGSVGLRLTHHFRL